jgi:hypothetical protein
MKIWTKAKWIPDLTWAFLCTSILIGIDEILFQVVLTGGFGSLIRFLSWVAYIIEIPGTVVLFLVGKNLDTVDRLSIAAASAVFNFPFFIGVLKLVRWFRNRKVA